jgi:hypothetical protein
MQGLWRAICANPQAGGDTLAAATAAGGILARTAASAVDQATTQCCEPTLAAMTRESAHASMDACSLQQSSRAPAAWSLLGNSKELRRGWIFAGLRPVSYALLIRPSTRRVSPYSVAPPDIGCHECP